MFLDSALYKFSIITRNINVIKHNINVFIIVHNINAIERYIKVFIIPINIYVLYFSAV